MGHERSGTAGVAEGAEKENVYARTYSRNARDMYRVHARTRTRAGRSVGSLAGRKGRGEGKENNRVAAVEE